MSKAEERANEKYPLMQEGDQEGLEALKYIGMECDSVYEFNSVRYSQQVYFIEGYHQAEKDLELTCDDISKIRQIMFDYNRQLRLEIVENKANLPKDEEYCREVLNRFKKGKG